MDANEHPAGLEGLNLPAQSSDPINDRVAVVAFMADIKSRKAKEKKRIEEAQDKLATLESEELQFCLQRLEDAKEKVRLARNKVQDVHLEREKYLLDKTRAEKRKNEALSALKTSGLEALQSRIDAFMSPKDPEVQERAANAENRAQRASAELMESVAELEQMTSEKVLLLEQNWKSANKSLCHAEEELNSLRDSLKPFDLQPE